MKSPSSRPLDKSLEYRAALALNNMAVTMMERSCYEMSFETLQDAAVAMRCVYDTTVANNAAETATAATCEEKTAEQCQADNEEQAAKRQQQQQLTEGEENQHQQEETKEQQQQAIQQNLGKAYRRAASLKHDAIKVDDAGVEFTGLSAFRINTVSEDEAFHPAASFFAAQLLSYTNMCDYYDPKNNDTTDFALAFENSLPFTVIRISTERLDPLPEDQDYDFCTSIILFNLAVATLIKAEALHVVVVDNRDDHDDDDSEPLMTRNTSTIDEDTATAAATATLVATLRNDALMILSFCRNLLEALILENLRHPITLHRIVFIATFVQQAFVNALFLIQRQQQQQQQNNQYHHQQAQQQRRRQLVQQQQQQQLGVGGEEAEQQQQSQDEENENIDNASILLQEQEQSDRDDTLYNRHRLTLQLACSTLSELSNMTGWLASEDPMAAGMFFQAPHSLAPAA